MIQSWRGKEAEAIFKGDRAKGVHSDLARAARRRLAQLDQAQSVEDMRSPPGNRLHLVEGKWSVSVNDQFRITFVWGANGPEDVWFGDYH
ncbi:MAG TPA: type II toxin-antitoxin system RelE/ParE family toxin [Caulobacteraceae bacterium]|jgi:proteic killer suppression protein|nr:type II toxin-antitoxin system RelE/ParE family toxin [Caulobacteraceae bacterium]